MSNVDDTIKSINEEAKHKVEEAEASATRALEEAKRQADRAYDKEIERAHELKHEEPNPLTKLGL